jgi:hypothetical protein
VVECTIERVTGSDVRSLEELRPPRPRLVELASAILVIGSFMDGAVAFESMVEATTQEARLFATASVLVAAGLIALGVLIRSARAWLLTLNVVAVAAFLELQSVTLGGILAALIDMVVVGILLRERAWFHWTPDPAGAARDA